MYRSVGLPELAMIFDRSAGAAPYHSAKHSAVFRTRPLLLLCVRATAVLLYHCTWRLGGWIGASVGGWVDVEGWVLGWALAN